MQTIHDHAANLDHLFSGMLSPPVISLAKRLTSVLPTGLGKTFFLSTGGESNEAAIKMAKMYTGKFEIVGLCGSWHGVSAQALGAQYVCSCRAEHSTSLTELQHFGRKGMGPLMPGMHMVRLQFLPIP